MYALWLYMSCQDFFVPNWSSASLIFWIALTLLNQWQINTIATTLPQFCNSLHVAQRKSAVYSLYQPIQIMHTLLSKCSTPPHWDCSMAVKSKSQVNIRDHLSQWDSRLAPLSDHQKDGFMQLGSAASFRPIPSQVSTCMYVHICTYRQMHSLLSLLSQAQTPSL